MSATAAKQAQCEQCGADAAGLRYLEGKRVCRDCSRLLKHEKFKERYEAARKAQENRVKAEKYKRRIQFAKKGKTAFQNRDYKTAVLNYETYIKVLEDGFELERGTLTPDHFESKAEQLLMSAIYWDLMRLFDRGKNPKEKEQFDYYMMKFLLFTKNTTWQRVYRNNLRRYIRWGNPRHRSEFIQLLKNLGGRPDRCFIATATFGGNALETQLLRDYRDERLKEFLLGRIFIETYYVLSPPIASLIGKSEFLKKLSRVVIKSLIKIWIH